MPPQLPQPQYEAPWDGSFPRITIEFPEKTPFKCFNFSASGSVCGSDGVVAPADHVGLPGIERGNDGIGDGHPSGAWREPLSNGSPPGMYPKAITVVLFSVGYARP